MRCVADGGDACRSRGDTTSNSLHHVHKPTPRKHRPPEDLRIVSSILRHLVLAAWGELTYRFGILMKGASPQQFVKVALVLPTEFAYARDVLRGIIAATRERN